MAKTVEDAARVLEVIAGRDPHDPRQYGVPTDDYTEALTGEVDDLRIGVLEEGFGFAGAEEGVNDAVRAAVDELAAAGADVEEVSIPWHVDGFFVWLAVENEEAAALWDAESTGYFVGGAYDTDFASAFANARRARADEFAPTVKLKCLLGGYLKEAFAGRYHGKAQNLRQDLRAAYDEAFEEFDLLAMPTTPMTAFELEEDVSRTEIVDRAQGKEGRTRNTMPFDMTGHPALSVPCGLSDGLPAGLMLVGPHADESTVLRAGDAFQRRVDWTERTF
jgi:amidase